MDIFWLLFVLVTIGIAVEAAAGFGSTLIIVSFGSLLMSIDDVLTIFIPLSFLMNLFIILRYRKQIQWKVLLFVAAPWVFLGFVGGYYLRNIGFSEVNFKRALGVFLIFVAGLELLNLRGAVTKFFHPIAFIIGGVAQSLFATGGPPIVYGLSDRITDKGQFRSTLQLFWLILNAAFMIQIFSKSLPNPYLYQYMVYLIPALPVGVGLGILLHKFIPQAFFKKAIFIVVALMGIYLVGTKELT